MGLRNLDNTGGPSRGVDVTSSPMSHRLLPPAAGLERLEDERQEPIRKSPGNNRSHSSPAGLPSSTMPSSGHSTTSAVLAEEIAEAANSTRQGVVSTATSVLCETPLEHTGKKGAGGGGTGAATCANSLARRPRSFSPAGAWGSASIVAEGMLHSSVAEGRATDGPVTTLAKPIWSSSGILDGLIDMDRWNNHSSSIGIACANSKAPSEGESEAGPGDDGTCSSSGSPSGSPSGSSSGIAPETASLPLTSIASWALVSAVVRATFSSLGEMRPATTSADLAGA